MLISLNTLSVRYVKIEQKINTLFELKSNRRKRGLINVVGTVSKFLLGTMSADDAEAINVQKKKKNKKNKKNFINSYMLQIFTT